MSSKGKQRKWGVRGGGGGGQKKISKTATQHTHRPPAQPCSRFTCPTDYYARTVGITAATRCRGRSDCVTKCCAPCERTSNIKSGANNSNGWKCAKVGNVFFVVRRPGSGYPQCISANGRDCQVFGYVRCIFCCIIAAWPANYQTRNVLYVSLYAGVRASEYMGTGECTCMCVHKIVYASVYILGRRPPWVQAAYYLFAASRVLTIEWYWYM